MKIFCDIGNTYAKILIVGKTLTIKRITKDKSIKLLRNYSKQDVYISCVVEEIEKKIKKKFPNFYFVGYKDIKNYIKIKYSGAQLGSDRAISAFAVKEIFGNNSLVISCGTAIVIDYINQKGEYVGGEIFPGFSLLINSLYYSTSKLPKLKIADIKTLKIKDFIGRDTYECIAKGILNFTTSGIKNIISHLKPRFIVLTGGGKDLLRKYIDTKGTHTVDQLVLIGLIIWGIKEGILNEEEISAIYRNLKNLLT